MWRLLSYSSIHVFARKLSKKTEKVNCPKSYGKINMEDAIKLTSRAYLWTWKKSLQHCSPITPQIQGVARPAGLSNLKTMSSQAKRHCKAISGSLSSSAGCKHRLVSSEVRNTKEHTGAALLAMRRRGSIVSWISQRRKKRYFHPKNSNETQNSTGKEKLGYTSHIPATKQSSRRMTPGTPLPAPWGTPEPAQRRVWSARAALVQAEVPKPTRGGHKHSAPLSCWMRSWLGNVDLASAR